MRLRIFGMMGLAALAAMALPAAADAQTISGCSSVASNRVATSTDVKKLQADVDCFNRAGAQASNAAMLRAGRIAALQPKPVPTPTPVPVPTPTPVPVPVPTPVPTPVPSVSDFVDCAVEGEICKATGWGEVRYGVGDNTIRLTVNGDVLCSNDTFRDPAPGVVKKCSRRVVPRPLQPGDIQPIASNFDRAALIQAGVGIPSSGKPDVVGAFRMICYGGQLSFDDWILYPNIKNGSKHLHQFFGNLQANYASTFESLRRSGKSTCNNELNRSSYWVPVMMNKAGKVILLDYVSLYYKRRPITDPECLRMALKGCVPLPVGLRAVSGYDMQRMGQEQGENKSFHFRCISPDKPSIHRPDLVQALADCGGSGQVMAAINFGDCWTGDLDSFDHRSHLTGGTYGDWGYYKCPASHPYAIPALTQGVVWTITPEDGQVYLSSDVMPGMDPMVPGTTMHADYGAAWDQPTADTWERECINKVLSCSSGVLGDGTMMKYEFNLTYKAPEPRVVDMPVR